MYIEKKSREKLHKDVTAFINGAAKIEAAGGGQQLIRYRASASESLRSLPLADVLYCADVGRNAIRTYVQ